MRELEVNVAYRWFLGLKLRDKVPDASTLSQNRRRRFAESTIYREIFDEIVLLAVNRGLASGTVPYTDSTRLKANANKNKYDLAEVQVEPQEYLAALDAAVTEDRAAQGKATLKVKPADSESKPERKEIKVSRTDKDSGYMVRDGKPKGFFYLDHRTVDGRHAIITDTCDAGQRARLGSVSWPSGPAAGAVRVRYPRGGTGRAQHLWSNRLSHADPPGRQLLQARVSLRSEAG
jgi:hypothetical protein